MSPLFIPLYLPVSILGIAAIIDFMDGFDGLVAGFLAVAVASAAFAFRLESIIRLLVCSLSIFVLELESSQCVYG